MSLDATQQKFITDGEALAKQSLDALGTAIDSILGNTEADVPKLDGEGIAAAFDAAENLIPTSVRMIVTGIFTVAEGAAVQASAPITASVVSALKIAQANVAAAVKHLGG